MTISSLSAGSSAAYLAIEASPQRQLDANADRAKALGAAETSEDQVNLSPAATRLLAARQNLLAREASPVTCTPSEWLRLQGKATVTAHRRAAADAEISRLEAVDPDHAATAHQARAFSLDAAEGGRRYENPFNGLDRVTLTAIVADEAGLFTSDERDAASREMNRQQQTWIQVHTIGGAGSGFFEEAKRQYMKLSPLERSCYPADYLQQCDRAAEAERSDEAPNHFWMDSSNESG